MLPAQGSSQTIRVCQSINQSATSACRHFNIDMHAAQPESTAPSVIKYLMRPYWFPHATKSSYHSNAYQLRPVYRVLFNG
jgi:hypothetical protein